MINKEKEKEKNDADALWIFILIVFVIVFTLIVRLGGLAVRGGCGTGAEFMIPPFAILIYYCLKLGENND